MGGNILTPSSELHMLNLVHQSGIECYESVYCTTQLEVRVWRVLDSGFSLCAVPTYYCRSKYSYSQHPQVQNSIITEHSLNKVECRVIIKLELFPIIQKLEFRDSE